MPAKQWRKWRRGARVVFNDVFASMYHCRGVIGHPSAAVQTIVQWRTTAFNAAWIAAQAVQNRAALLAAGD